jgi:hypothetical protein
MGIKPSEWSPSDDSDDSTESDNTDNSQSSDIGSGFSSASTTDNKPSSNGSWGGRDTSLSPGQKKYLDSRWNTRIDWSTPYILIARKRATRNSDEQIYKHEGELAILDDRNDWRRLDDHPDGEFEVILRVDTKLEWTKFCSELKRKHDADAYELMENNVNLLRQYYDDIVLPPVRHPNNTPTCRVCGSVQAEQDVNLVEIDLHKTRKALVCDDHTVSELAEQNLIL